MTKQTPVCECGRVMTVKENGVKVLTVTEPGLDYQVWVMDEWVCPIDGRTVLSGCGANPITEHWKPDFDMTVKREGTRLRRAYYGVPPTVAPNAAEERANYEQACKTIVEMYSAVFGENAIPAQDPVKDLAAVRAALVKVTASSDMNQLEDAQGAVLRALRMTDDAIRVDGAAE